MSKCEIGLHFQLPVIKLSYEEHSFPVFTNMYSTINLLDSGGEAIFIDRASLDSCLKLLNHPVLMTWKNTAMSQHFGTRWKTVTYHKHSQTLRASCIDCNAKAAEGCNLGETLCSPGNPALSCWQNLGDTLQTTHYSTSEYVRHAFGRDVISSINMSTDAG